MGVENYFRLGGLAPQGFAAAQGFTAAQGFVVAQGFAAAQGLLGFARRGRPHCGKAIKRITAAAPR